MPYKSIEGLTYSTGMMFGGVQITGIGGAGWRIEDVVPKDSAKQFADVVRGLVEDEHGKSKPNETLLLHTGQETPSVADELVKLAALVKDGFFTQEEFNAAKKRLLEL